MSTAVDKRVVEMVFNNKDFMKNMNSTSKALDSFDNQINDLGKTSGFNKVANATKPLATAIEGISAKAVVMQEVISKVTGKIVDSIFNMVGKINNKINELTFDQIGAGFNKYEEKIKSVQTIMNATGESIDVVNEQLAKLMWYSDETSYSFTDMTSNVGKFTSVGISLDDSVTAMMGIANWAALSGAGVQEASRAMYNFSQAMGAGVMMTKDWVSIENANMATKEFKETVIETAKELKAMGKLGEDYDYDLESLTYENFRDSLSDGWFTKPIMEEALKKYGNYTEELYKIKQEFEDIGEYKTVDELKQIYDERLRQSEEVINSVSTAYKKYGRESKEFRDIINQNGITMQTALDLISGQENEEFNKKLEKDAETLKKVADEFGVDSDKFKEAAKAAGYSMEDAAEIVEKGITRFQKATKSVSERGFAAGQEAKTFTDAWEAAKDAVSSQWATLYEQIFGNYEEAKIMWTALANTMWDVFAGPVELLNEVVGLWVELGGREKLFDTETGAIANMWNALTEMFENVKKALVDVFPIFENYENFGWILYDITERFHKFTENLTLNGYQTRILTSVLKGIFSVLKFVGNTIKTIGESLSMIFKAILPEDLNWDKVLKFSRRLQDLDQVSKDFYAGVMAFTGQVITKIHQIKTYLSTLDFGNMFDNIKAKFQPVLDIFNSFGLSSENLNAKIEKFKLSFQSKTEKFEQGTKAVKTHADTISKFLQPVIDFINKGLEKSAALFDKIKLLLSDIPGLANKAFGMIFDWIAKLTAKFMQLNPNELLTFFNGTIIGGILLGIKKFVKNLNKSTKSVTSIADSIKGVAKSISGTISSLGKTFDAVTNNLEAMQKKVSAETLRSIATSVLMLAGAAVVLSLIDSSQLSTVLTAMAASLSELLIAYYFLSEQSGDIADTAKLKMASDILIKLAGTILLVSMAMNAFAELDSTELRNGVLGLSAAISALIAFYGALVLIVDNTDQTKKIEMRIKQMSGSLLMLTGAISTLGISVKLFGTMKLEDLGKGLLGVAGLMTFLYLFLIGLTKMTDSEHFDAKKIIAISVAMNLIAYALIALMIPVLIMGTMKFDALAKGLGGIFILLFEIVAVFEFLSKKMGKDMGAGKLLAIALAMDMMAAAIIGLSIPVFIMGRFLDGGQLIKGLIGVAVLLLEVGVFTKIISKMEVSAAKLLSVGVTMGIMAVSLLILAGTVKKLGEMDLMQLIQGLVATAVMLGMVFGFLKLMSLVSVAELVKASVVSLIFMSLAFSLTVLGTAIKSFEQIDVLTILKALLSMAAFLLVLGGLGAILSPVLLPMLALALILPIIGAGLLLLAIGIQAFATILEQTNPFVQMAQEIEQIKTWFESAREKFKEFKEKWLEGWNTLTQPVKDWVANFKDKWKEWWYNFAKKIEQIKTWFESAREKFKEFKEKWLEGWNTLTQPVKDWVANFKDKWKEWWYNFAKKAVDPFLQFGSKWNEFWGGIGAKVREIVDYIAQDVTKRFDEAVDKLTEFLSPFFEIVENLLTKLEELKTGLSEGWNNFWDNWQQGVDDLGYTLFGDNGSDTSYAYNAGAAQGEAYVQGAQDSLDIHSPSKKTEEEVGIPAAQGIVNGTTEGLTGKEAKEQMKQAGSEAMQNATDGMIGQLFGSKDEVKDKIVSKISEMVGIDKDELKKKFGGAEGLLSALGINVDSIDLTKGVDINSLVQNADLSKLTSNVDLGNISLDTSNLTLDTSNLNIDASGAMLNTDNIGYDFDESQIHTLAEYQGSMLADGMAEGYAKNSDKVTDSINDSVSKANTDVSINNDTKSTSTTNQNGIEMIKRFVNGEETLAAKTLDLVKPIKQIEKLPKAVEKLKEDIVVPADETNPDVVWRHKDKTDYWVLTDKDGNYILKDGMMQTQKWIDPESQEGKANKELKAKFAEQERNEMLQERAIGKLVHGIDAKGDSYFGREYTAGKVILTDANGHILKTENGMITIYDPKAKEWTQTTMEAQRKRDEALLKAANTVSSSKNASGTTSSKSTTSATTSATTDLDTEAAKKKTSQASSAKSTGSSSKAQTGTSASSATQTAATSLDYLREMNSRMAMIYDKVVSLDSNLSAANNYLNSINNNTYTSATKPIPAVVDSNQAVRELIGPLNKALGITAGLTRRGVTS